MHRAFLRRFASWAATAALGASSGAMAATATTNVAVTTNVTANCAIVATPVAFGTYDPISPAALSGTGTLTVTCTQGAAASITLGNGQNFASSRRMTNGSAFIGYQVYTPSSNLPLAPCATVTPWPDTAPGFVLPVAPSNAPRTFNVCGLIPAGQDAPSGNYVDSMVATVIF